MLALFTYDGDMWVLSIHSYTGVVKSKWNTIHAAYSYWEYVKENIN